MEECDSSHVPVPGSPKAALARIGPEGLFIAGIPMQPYRSLQDRALPLTAFEHYLRNLCVVIETGK